MSDQEDIDRGLLTALHGFAGSEKRWASRRAQGLTDRELMDAIREEFYLGGGFWHSGLPPCCYQGGATPAFHSGALSPHKAKTTLKNKTLMDRVRQLLCIPWPHQGLQRKLF